MNEQVEYIGDGVYASFDGFQLRLWTERATGTHEIFMEPREWDNLIRVMNQWKSQEVE